MAELMNGGLGRKQLTLFKYDGAAEIHSEILYAFAILREGGGYELLRVSDCGPRNTLHVIPQPAQGYSVSYLKEVVRQAKVYIRPVQRDLQMNPEVQSAPDSVTILYYAKCVEASLKMFVLAGLSLGRVLCMQQTHTSPSA